MISKKRYFTGLMASKSFEIISKLSEDEIERVLNIPAQKRTKEDKQNLNYFRILLSIAQKRKVNYKIIKKMP